MSIRNVREKARRDLHNQLKVPVLYITDTTVATFCRVHTKERTIIGDEYGPYAAQVLDIQPRLVWWVGVDPEIAVDDLKRNAVVSVEEGEAYKIASFLPRHRETITTLAIRMAENETVGLALP